MLHSRFARIALTVCLLGLSSCVVEPGYDEGPPPPAYGGAYYGYGPSYPWNSGVNIDIGGGYGHGGYYRGGHYGGWGYGGGRGFHR